MSHPGDQVLAEVRPPEPQEYFSGYTRIQIDEALFPVDSEDTTRRLIATSTPRRWVFCAKAPNPELPRPFVRYCTPRETQDLVAINKAVRLMGVDGPNGSCHIVGWVPRQQ